MMIAAARRIARDAHLGQTYAGRSFFTHHVALVAGVLAHVGADAELVAAGYLHDVIEDTDYTPDDLAPFFPARTLTAVAGCTVPRGVTRRQRPERYYPLLVGCGIDAITVKLADTLCNWSASFGTALDAMYRREYPGLRAAVAPSVPAGSPAAALLDRLDRISAGAAVDVQSVRLGWATNSSSTHSIVIIPGGAPDRDVEPGVTGPADQNFGWDNWIAGSVPAKMAWIGQCIRLNLTKQIGDELAAIVASDLTGIDILSDGGVDHQSVPTFPITAGARGGHLSVDFLRDVVSVLRAPDTVILGGNDNSEGHPLATHPEINLGLPLDGGDPPRSRRDTRDGYWTLYAPWSGTKTRLRLGSPGAPIVRAEAPELVDLKITDHCPIGCAFCYQDSTAAGRHADTGYVTSVAYGLAGMGVFEVALGGGEPSLHPDFLGICKTFASLGVTPNVTTKRLDWIRNKESRTAFLSCGGACAYSVDTAAQVTALARTLSRVRDETGGRVNRRFAIQHVLGTVPLDRVIGIRDAALSAGFRLTLLGYKQVGRGPSVTPLDVRGWAAPILADRRGSVGIDTVLAQTWADELRDLNAWSGSYETREGAFSCYIDAVARTLSASSFDTTAPIPIAGYPAARTILDLYGQMQRGAGIA